MTITELVLLGLALSMDAFAVTISNTFIYQGNSRARNILMPIAFGLFQGLMPCIGYILGRLVSDVISQYAGIITFAILGFIGAKMIWDALHEEAKVTKTSPKKTARATLPTQVRFLRYQYSHSKQLQPALTPLRLV